MIQLTSSVGVAPGTTTIQANPGGELSCGLGVCQPGYYGQAIMLPGSAPAPQPGGATAPVAWIPYATESRLRGLGALPTVRWELIVLSFGLAFAGVLGYSWYKARRK